MLDLYNKTLSHSPNIQEQWFLLDASKITLGKLATLTSILLRGKLDLYYTPGVNNGNYVIIINANQIQVTGNKKAKKLYWRHSGRPGGLTLETFNELLDKKPERIIEKAVKGMLPKNSLGRAYFRRLKVYKDATHPFTEKNIEILKV